MINNNKSIIWIFCIYSLYLMYYNFPLFNYDVHITTLGLLNQVYELRFVDLGRIEKFNIDASSKYQAITSTIVLETVQDDVKHNC